jgi:hypothetical protein
LLAGSAVPAIGRTRETARRRECSSHLREIGIGLASYAENNQALPAGWSPDPSGRSAFGWSTAILPWFDQRLVPEQLHRDRTLDDAANEVALPHPIPILQCPSDFPPARFALFSEQDENLEYYVQASLQVLISLPSASYVGIFGTHDPDDRSGRLGEGALGSVRPVRYSELERGLIQTMFVSERTARKPPTTRVGFLAEGEDAIARVVGYADAGPNRDDADEAEFDSRHTGLIHVL